MTRTVIRSLAGAAAGAALVATSFVGVASAEPPRPGCGYGDDNHSHQAAPGQDDLRPGNGPAANNGNGGGVATGFTHTAPPGQVDNVPNDDPARGCKPDPRD